MRSLALVLGAWSVVFLLGTRLRAEETILLWPAGAPGAVGNQAEDRPTLSVFLPDPTRANGTAVVIFPGGGYTHLATRHEGSDVAAWLNQRGIAGIVLRYRLTPRYPHPAPLADATRAIRHVRANASRWGIDSRRIGIWGFSAGGHLGSLVSTHFDRGDADAADPVARAGSRPDFAILCYPLISLKGNYASAFIRYRLLGPEPAPDLVESLSSETRVNSQTPPTFLFHTADDASVSSEQSLLYYSALRRAGVPAELHIFSSGRHGLGLAPKHPILASWPEQLEQWLAARGLLDPSVTPDPRPMPPSPTSISPGSR